MILYSPLCPHNLSDPMGFMLCHCKWSMSIKKPNLSWLCCQCQENVRGGKKVPELFSDLFVCFLFRSFVALLKLLVMGWFRLAPPPSSLPHTFPLAIRNYHTVRVLACPKATAGLMFLAWLLSDMPGKGKERKWVDQSLSVPPKQAWEKPAQCFSTRLSL